MKIAPHPAFQLRVRMELHLERLGPARRLTQPQRRADPVRRYRGPRRQAADSQAGYRSLLRSAELNDKHARCAARFTFRRARGWFPSPLKVCRWGGYLERFERGIPIEDQLPDG